MIQLIIIHKASAQPTRHNTLQQVLSTNAESGTFQIREMPLHEALTQPTDSALYLIDVDEMDQEALESINRDNLDNRHIVLIGQEITTEFRTRAYTSGVADVISLPCPPQEILARLSRVGRYLSTRTELQQALGAASSTALTVLKGSGEIGLVMTYAEQLYRAHHHLDVARLFFGVMHQLGLQGYLLFMDGKGPAFFGSDTAVPAGEQQRMLEQFNITQRFIDEGNHTQINYTHVALRITNMPIENAEQYGRYKDLLPSMLSVTDLKLQQLKLDLERVYSIQQQIMMLTELKQNHPPESTMAAQLDTLIARSHDELKRLTLSEQTNTQLENGASGPAPPSNIELF